MKLAQGSSSTDEITQTISETQNELDKAFKNDFNTHLALSSFFKFVNKINQLAASETLTKSISEVGLPFFEKLMYIFGLKIPKITDDEINEVNDLINHTCAPPSRT